MKKTILAIILAGSSAAICAQDTTNMNNTRMDSAQNTTGVQTSTGDYSAYANMPPSIQRNFQAQYPGVTNAQWQPTYNGFWRASYMQNGQWMNVNYSPRGESFMVALPVLQSSVPAEIVSKAMDLYGGNVYDISLVKLPNPEVAAMDSMIAAAVMNANANANAGVTTGMDTTAMMDDATGDTTTTVPSGVTSYPPNTFWGVDTTGRAAMTPTIDLYLVRIIDNGMLRAQRMNADGSPDLSYGTTMASPMPSNVNMNNNMNQNLTTTNVSTTSMPTSFSAYYGTGTTGVSTDVNTSAYPAKDSTANTTVDTTAAAIDTTATAPITDTTSRAVTDTTSSTITDTTSTQVTDTTSNASSVNPTGDMNSNNTQVQTESGNVSTSTSTDMNNNTNTNKKNKKNKKNKNSTDSSNGTTTPSGTSGY
jgi:hypothetical protein